MAILEIASLADLVNLEFRPDLSHVVASWRTAPEELRLHILGYLPAVILARLCRKIPGLRKDKTLWKRHTARDPPRHPYIRPSLDRFESHALRTASTPLMHPMEGSKPSFATWLIYWKQLSQYEQEIISRYAIDLNVASAAGLKNFREAVYGFEEAKAILQMRNPWEANKHYQGTITARASLRLPPMEHQDHVEWSVSLLNEAVHSFTGLVRLDENAHTIITLYAAPLCTQHSIELPREKTVELITLCCRCMVRRAPMIPYMWRTITVARDISQCKLPREEISKTAGKIRTMGHEGPSIANDMLNAIRTQHEGDSRWYKLLHARS